MISHLALILFYEQMIQQKALLKWDGKRQRLIKCLKVANAQPNKSVCVSELFASQINSFVYRANDII